MSPKLEKILMFLVTVVLFACVIFGRCTKHSFADDTNLEKYVSKKNLPLCYCDMGYDKDTNVGFLDGEKIQDITDMMQDDIVIVKAHVKKGEKRSIYYECVLSDMEIDQVYQGKCNKKDEIACFEPVDCSRTEMECTDGYSLMQEGKEYILFLKPLKNAGYGNAKYVYAPVSTTYGKYLDEDKPPRLFDKKQLEDADSLLKYQEVKKEEVFLYNEKMFQKYCKLKKQARELFKS